MRATLALSFGLVTALLVVGCNANNQTGGVEGAGASTSSTNQGGNGGTTTNEGGTTTNEGGGTTTTGDGGSGAGTTSSTTAGECLGGTADCNGDPADGCETNLLGDVNNCGSCGKVCEGGGGVPPVCAVGQCKLDCNAGQGNCDGDLANGCEANLLDDAQNCGTCGNTCMGSPCIEGACACAAETTEGNFAPLDLFIMLDESGSMSETVPGGGTRWQAVTTALKSFISNPANSALGVGIQYFPLASGAACNPFCSTDADCGAFGPCLFGICFTCLAAGDSCNPADYAMPAVPIAALSANQIANLTNSINSHGPTNNTPTGPALQGAVNHAKSWAMANPSHNVIVVLATDGEPTECTPGDIPGIANLAAAAVNGSPSIKTFVIGVGPSLSNLNAIAAGGGTGQAFLVADANAVQQFEAALDQIQQSILGCEYGIPQPAMGMLDYGKVNVQYTPGGGGSPQLILNVMNQAGCDPATGGWYYDNNNSPTKIVLCPQTCAPIEGDPNGKVDVLLGCATEHM